MACIVAVMLFALSVTPACVRGEEASTTGTVDGFVVDQVNGLPIQGANIALFRVETFVRATTTNKDGEFKLKDVPAGAYTVSIASAGYQISRSREFTVRPGEETAVNVAVSRATQSQQSGSLRTIGTVSVSAASTLATTTTITRIVDPSVLQSEANLNLGYSLAKVPGVNSTGLSSSISDDQYLNIRGLGASETQALLDGHPIGPQGVYGINGGGSYPTAFNYSDSPIFGLSRVQVTFGSGATGLYGVDAIGGTIDMQTINPTLQRVFKFSDGIGDQGREMTSFTLTGSDGKLGYAFAGGVQGAYGMFAPGLVTQTGRPNNNANLNNNGACTASNDISPCNTALNTYSVSQNTNLRSGLAKLKYDLSNNTSFTTTVFASGQQSDSTGNGDNDNIPYDTRLAQIKSNPGNCSLPTDPPSKTSGYQVITQEGAPPQCYTAAQWALNS